MRPGHRRARRRGAGRSTSPAAASRWATRRAPTSTRALSSRDAAARVRAQDQPRAAVVGQVRPGPREEHHEAVAEADQEEDVDEQPGEPRERARTAAAGRSARRRCAGRSSRASPCRGSGTGRSGSPRTARADVGRRVRRPSASRPARRPAPAARPARARRGRRSRTRSGCPGTVRSGSTRTRPARSSGAPRSGASGEAWTPAAQSTVRAAIALGADPDAARVDGGHERAGPDLDAERLELELRLRRQLLGVRGQHARAALEQDDARRARVDAAEVARERVARDLGERAGHLDAGRPPPTTTNVSHWRRASARLLPLGGLEGQQHAPADLERVLERLEPGRDAPPTRRGRSTSASRPSRARGSRTRARRPRGGRASRPASIATASPEQHLRVALAAEDAPDRVRRCRPARARRSRPGRAAAGTGGGSCGRRA